MTTTEQQAGATEREAVERMVRWLCPDAPLFVWWDVMRAVQIPVAGGPRHFNPFTNPADERELLTAVQERWGRAGMEEPVDGNARMRWNTFVLNMRRCHPSTGFPLSATLYLLEPGAIARAVDAVLREYPE